MHTHSLLFLLLLCTYTCAQNLLANPSFESKTSSWTPLTNGYSVVKDAAQDGVYSIRCLSLTKSGTRGATQTITVNQQSPSTITVSAWSYPSLVSGTGSYAIQLDIVQMDGKKISGVQAKFDDKSSQWTNRAISYKADSVQKITVSLIFSNKAGIVWFDNLVATVTPVVVTPTSVPTTLPTSFPLPVPSDAPTVAPSTPAPSTLSPVTPAPSTSAPATGTPSDSPTTAPVTSAPTPAATSAPTPAPTPAPAPTAPPLPGTIQIGFKYLILSATRDDIRLLVAMQTFDSVGSQYDVIVPSEWTNKSFPLTNSTSVANYYGVVFCTDVYGASADQIAQVNNYLATYKIKSVLMYTYPYPPNGVTVSATKNANADPSDLYFASAAANFIAGYNKTTRIPSDAVYSYPAVITNTSMATPAMYFAYPGDATQYIASAFINFPDGRRQLQFYLDMAVWAPHAVAVGPFWLQWLSNNIFLGLRRIYLNAQLDDLFLASDLWDPDWTPVGQHEDGPIYRINETELYNHVIWQRALNARLPATSNITIDFPYNGNGIIEAGGFTKDKLYLMAKQLINDFTWQSHTYTHPYLDNLTYNEAKLEMTENLLPTTLQLFGSYNHPRYSNKSMVTPSISGLYNANAMKALWDVGIRSVVGDNSRTDLKTPFQYHGFYTTIEKNGFAGLYIMPREATYIYYDCSIPRELESEYNHLYTTYYGGPSTLDDIVTREGKRVTLLFLAFRIDPYMFHQANMREYLDPATGKNTSLLRHWIEAVVARFYMYYDLPIHAHTHDLLTQKWLNRESRDSCGFQSTLTVNTATWQATGISGSSTGQCSMAITGVQVSAAASKFTEEKYGPDTTTWVSMNRDKMSFNFKIPVKM
eukprot:TRINITY_DN1042_c0_g2_i1.p1 TRINITY_DN1042_c0_g2~~TRINITY_DN1042_c0_g2_i1.p1  ORF type:complete len:869 (+),score=262.17 TRINITY_DN1042_c0_g2_i1:138-2744(+)